MSAHLQTIKPPIANSVFGRSFAGWQGGSRLNWREVMFRAGAVLATAFFVVRAALAVADNPGRVTLLLLVLSESLSAVLLLLSNVPKSRDSHPVALLCVVWAYVYCACFGVDQGAALVGTACGSAICCAGVLLAIWGKMTIGTSFGLLPAARDVVSSGPYRFVRHPIYVGYFITHTGFILSDFTVRNLIVLVTLYLCQIVRVLREETVLSQDAAYRAYRRDVPYRFIYGLV